jgi:hypothetical protein
MRNNGPRIGLGHFLIAGAGQNREPGVLGEAWIGKREIAEDEDGAVSGFDPPGMQAIGTEASS